MTDPVGDRSHFVISKSSYYWLNESIRLMQQHIEYGTTFDAALLGEIVEIERNLKALKCNVEKQGIAKTFYFRAEALVNFIRLCCTLHGKSISFITRLNVAKYHLRRKSSRKISSTLTRAIQCLCELLAAYV